MHRGHGQTWGSRMLDQGSLKTTRYNQSLVAAPSVVASYRRIPLPTVDNTEVLEGHREPSLQIFRHVRVEFEFTAQCVGKQSGLSFYCRVRNYNAFTITG